MDDNESMCGLCGHAPACGFAESDGVRLCHADDHSCYHRWTVYGERGSTPTVRCYLCGNRVLRGDTELVRYRVPSAARGGTLQGVHRYVRMCKVGHGCKGATDG